jgi:uncharacterized protein YgiB involved in biofilm formation
MSDEGDLATAREEQERERFIEHARKKAQAAAGVAAVFCVNGCGEKPRDGSRYCSSDCRDDHAERQARLKRQGAR